MSRTHKPTNTPFEPLLLKHLNSSGNCRKATKSKTTIGRYNQKTLKCKNIHLQQVTTTDSSEIAKYIYSYLLCSSTFRLHQCYTMTINRSNRRVDSLLPLELLKYCQNAQIAKSSFLSIVSLNSEEGVHTQCLCI